MNTGTGEFDDLDKVAARHGVGVRKSVGRVQCYELAVIGLDVADVVRSAGGWMCERVRAGWRVTVLMPAGSDTRPLRVLGVNPAQLETDYGSLWTSFPAALAMASGVVVTDERVARDVRKALLRGVTEVTFWGEASLSDVDAPVDLVQHRLSGVARAFKAQALIAASSFDIQAAPTETFHSTALWYPLDGSDLTPPS